MSKFITVIMKNNFFFAENHNYLEKYLIELAPAERNSKILDWSTGGAVYLTYINLCKALQEMKKVFLYYYFLIIYTFMYEWCVKSNLKFFVVFCFCCQNLSLPPFLQVSLLHFKP